MDEARFAEPCWWGPLAFEFRDTQSKRALCYRVELRVGLSIFPIFGLVYVLLSSGFGSEFVTHRAHFSRTPKRRVVLDGV